MEDIVVPIALFASIFGIVAIIALFRYRSQREVQETVRALLNSDQPLTDDRLNELVNALNPSGQDLRRGVISIAIAIAVGIFAFAVDEGDAVYPLLGIAAFPFLIGTAYFLLWKMGQNKAAA